MRGNQIRHVSHWIFCGVVLIISLTINYVSLRRALRYGYGFLLPIKATSGYKLDWLVGKLYFSGGTMITKFDGDISIAAAPIEPIMVVVVSKNKILWHWFLYLR
jgi:hypothetical protein